MEKDRFTKQWITDNSLTIVKRYEKGILTLRGLHYQLVSIGMTNSLRHYKRVVNAMIDARWEEIVDFDAFSDHDREMIGITEFEETILEDEISRGKNQIAAWMHNYNKKRWENQPYYPEVFIEKKALQGVFNPICERYDVALGACKGYPSLTFLNDSAIRFNEAASNGKYPIILYFGDYDPSGEDIPRSIEANIKRLGCYEIQLKRFALLHEQVIEWELPPAPAKVGDSRTANWDGIGQVELDAINPKKLQELCENAIREYFDDDLYEELLETEYAERETYIAKLKEHVQNL